MANYVPSIDYTSRDYASILTDMTNLIPNFSPKWTNRDPADFGMTLLELFSYMGDILNYYIDRAANESFITTATQRSSVLQLASILGYAPTNSTAATVTLTFQNSTASPITIPALTQVATSLVANATTTQIVFETDAALTIPAAVSGVNGSATVTATQGTTVSNEIIGTSTGNPGQAYALSNTSVINNSIQVTINGLSYTKVDYLIDYSNFDPVFSAFTNANNVTYLTFGDGISGIIPPNGASIYATYRIGGGAIGNVAANTIKYILSVPGYSIPAGLSVLNQTGAATGGADNESTDSIRINAPLSIRSINRAVSLSDYSTLAVQVSGVSKAVATANVYTSITLYLVPAGDPGVAADNSTATAAFTGAASNVLNYLLDKAPANTTITFQPPKYAGVYLVITLTVAPKYRQSTVVNNVKAALNNLFYIDNVYFGQTISVSDVNYAISNVDGVAYQQVTKMVRADQDQTYTITNKALSSNVATLTTSTTHTLTVGQTVSVTGVDATFNGTFVVTAISSNTFSYALIAATVGSTSATGSVTALTIKDIVCASNELPTLYALGTVASPSATGIGSVTVNASGGILS